MATCTWIRKPADRRRIERSAILVSVLLVLNGCATIEDRADRVRDFAKAHPVAIAVGTAVVVGAIVASTHHSHDNHQRIVTARPGDPCALRMTCAP